MECADTFMLTRTILLWRSRNLCVHQTILSTWKRNYRKWILLIFVRERERVNTKWKFYKLTNLKIFAALLKDIPMGCKDTVLPEPILKNHNVNCLTFERKTSQPYNDNLCLFRAVALHLFGNERLEEETSKMFNLSQKTVKKVTSQSSRVFISMTFQKLKTCCKSISSFITLILWMENRLVSSVEEVFKSMKKVSSFYATTITFATSTTSMHCSKLSDVLRVTHFSQRRGIWNDILLPVVIVLNIFTQRMFTNWEKHFLKSWMHSTSRIDMIKNYSRTWQYLTLNPIVSRKTLTSQLRQQHGLGSMFLY